MLSLNEIRSLHLEISSYCNARCPLCPRNLFGYPFNGGYEETNLTLDLIKKRLSPEFISNLNQLLFNGNFGDFHMNPEAISIVEYFRKSNPNISIKISTNGSARNLQFWQNLADLKTTIEFCLDGLENTHHLYRQDTDWNKIIKNAKAFIEAGGIAVWKMIPFDHNKHQIDECRQLSKQLGFSYFRLNDQGRDQGPVFNRTGKRTHTLGKNKALTNFKKIDQAEYWINKKTNNDFLKKEIPNTKLKCHTLLTRDIYISAEGYVYPCCFLGFSPQTYSFGPLGLLNEQIKSIMTRNKLSDYDLETCIKWFHKVQESWNMDSYEKGRIYKCDISCNGCNR